MTRRTTPPSRKPLMIELFAGLHGWGEGAGGAAVVFDRVESQRDGGRMRPRR